MTYIPPSPSNIKKTQNQDANLRLLLAQRRLYTRAKVWAHVRGIGIGVVAVAAPITAAIHPGAAVWVGTIAAIWFALNRLVFRPLEHHQAALGAVVQEQFDTAVFGMPQIAVRDVRVLPEEVARLTGDRVRRKAAYSDEKLRNWYSIEDGAGGDVAVAVAQRGNVAYSQTLLSRSANLWLSLLVGWGFVAIAISLLSHFSLSTFLLTVAIPVLPPLLDAFDLWREVRSAGKERRAMANEIEDAVKARASSPLKPEQLVAWQAQLFSLRRDSPQVPDWLYWLLRERNEREMSEAARTLVAGVVADEGKNKK